MAGPVDARWASPYQSSLPLSWAETHSDVGTDMHMHKLKLKLTCKGQCCWRPNIITLAGAGAFLALVHIVRGTRPQSSVAMPRKATLHAPLRVRAVQEAVDNVCLVLANG